MGDPQPVNAAGGDSYRLGKYSLFFSWAYLALAGALSAAYTPLGFVLMPFVLLFNRLNPYRFVILWIASGLFFFETFLRANFYFLSVGDLLPVLYGFLLLLTAIPRGFVFRVPMNAAFAWLYLFVGLTLALMPKAIAGNPPLYALFDLKTVLLIGFSAVLVALLGPERSPKRVFLILGTVILFSSVHAVELLAQFAAGVARPYSWTGIFLANSILFCLILLRLPFSKSTHWQLRIALILCSLGVLVAQTRGIWLSTAACLGLLFLGNLIAMRGRMVSFLVRFALIAGISLILVNLVFYALAGMSLQGFVGQRLGDLEWIGLLDPYSSTGYRVHESWAVWDERTFWGHGPGATLNLFFTQMETSDFKDWWSIHSGYFEILHKYGFAGILLMGGMTVALCVRALRMLRVGQRWQSAAGAAALLMVLNHAIVSISSNEFTRANSPLMWFLAFYLTTNLAPRDGASAEAPAPAPAGKP